MVDNEKANEQRLPVAAKRPYGLNWTRLLNEMGLESPGYQETVAKMKAKRQASKGK
jgi:hypothetical protein